MDIAQAVDFIRNNHRAVLHTFRRDGSPQLSPVAVGVDGGGRPIVSSRETAFKTKNLLRDPRATLCVLNDQFYGEWVYVDGVCEVVHLPEAMDLLVAYYRQVRGEEHPDWDEYRAAMEAERRVILRIAVERAGPNAQG
jgi:PPOX class probable F420-dependent enzyme